MRATNFLKIILENKNLNPKYFSAKGYGEYHPIASNDTPNGRAKNRRVEVLILPKNEEGSDR
jgi:chemotaxis protein MotB